MSSKVSVPQIMSDHKLSHFCPPQATEEEVLDALAAVTGSVLEDEVALLALLRPPLTREARSVDRLLGNQKPPSPTRQWGKQRKPALLDFAICDLPSRHSCARVRPGNFLGMEEGAALGKKIWLDPSPSRWGGGLLPAPARAGPS